MAGKIFRYYGFDHPPVGLMSVVDQVPVSGTFYILDPIGSDDLPYDEIMPNDRVIITTHEPACHAWFDRLIPRLLQAHGLSNSHVILHSSCLWDPDSPIPLVSSPVDELTDFLGRFDVSIVPRDPPASHFVCLNRLPRWQRVELVRGLLDRDLVKHGAVSHGVVSGDDRFPLVVDFANPTYDQSYIIDNSTIRDAMINVITESCYERHPDSQIYESHPRPGLTEKTYKSIILGQLPIFLASYRTVACYRDLGFDAFDDIIDHGYDLERDPVVRISLVLDEIGKQCQQPLINYREKLHDRFQANLDLLRRMRGDYQRELPRWLQLLT